MANGALAMREALKGIPVSARLEWAQANQGVFGSSGAACATCGPVCAYHTHWSGERLSKAYSDLCGGASPVSTVEEIATALTEEITPKAPTVRETGDPADLLARAVEAIAGRSKGAVDVKEVRAIVDTATAAITARIEALEKKGAPAVLHVKVADRPVVKIDLAHDRFPDLFRRAQVRLSDGTAPNLLLVGPAGSGKTTAAAQLAKALGVPFFFNGAIDSEYKLTGFVDAQGRIVSTAFRAAYTQPSVYLFDEVDVSLPSACLAFNAALSNGHADFPGAETPLERHPDCVVLAGANTNGLGATAEHSGRFKMDEAFRDRFSFLDWPVDERLERACAGEGADAWVTYVQRLRARAKALGLHVSISPRASIRGAAYLKAGMTWDDAVDSEIRNRMSAENFEAVTR